MSVRNRRQVGNVSGERPSQAKQGPRSRNNTALQGVFNRKTNTAIHTVSGKAIPTYTTSGQQRINAYPMGSTRLTYVRVMNNETINDFTVRKMNDGLGMAIAIGKCQDEIRELGYGSTLDPEYYYQELRPRKAPIDPPQLPIYAQVAPAVRTRLMSDYKTLSIHQQKDITAIERPSIRPNASRTKW